LIIAAQLENNSSVQQLSNIITVSSATKKQLDKHQSNKPYYGASQQPTNSLILLNPNTLINPIKPIFLFIITVKKKLSLCNKIA
jgi:hypothetical protein